MEGAVRLARSVVHALGLIALVAPIALAQSLCDVDGDGSITDVDGVNVLRAAALLPSACTLVLCDADDDGAITDVDGVNVLRAAAALSSVCEVPDGPEVTDFVTGIRDAGGPAALRIGTAPIPGPGAPMTVQNLEGTEQVTPNGSGGATFDVGAGGAAKGAGGADSTVLVRARAEDGTVATNFFELALAGDGVDLEFDVANVPVGSSFKLDFATRNGGVVSVYETLDVFVICLIPLDTVCVGGPNDGQTGCNTDPCETACNPRSCDDPECPGGECQLVLVPKF
jgi:hypothetical protein